MSNGKLRKQIIYVTIMPLIVLGLVCSAVFFVRLNEYSRQKTEEVLKYLAINGTDVYEQTGKGPQKADNYEWFIYEEDKCIDSSLSSAVDGYMKNTTYSKLTSTGQSVYEKNVLINNQRYMLYYTSISPTKFFACAISNKTIWETMKDALLPTYAIEGIVMAIAVVLVVFFINSLTHELTRIRNFVSDIANEKLDTQLADELYNRDDELGDIGRGVVVMRNALKDIIEIDPLTRLYNRKTGEKKLRAIKERCKKRNQPYSIAIGDIDHFKNVNDTWGHDAGDIILQNIAEILKTTLDKKAIVARWGGEEFFIAFENCDRAKAGEYLEKTLETIRGFTSKDGKGNFIKVTMTFGVVNGSFTKTDEELFKIADNKLYYGKEHGRNQVVCVRKQENT